MPQIAAIGVTSYAGGASGHDPVRIAAGVASLGLTPNIHLTCVGQDRRGIANTLATLESLRIHNTFCISGDWPEELRRRRPSSTSTRCSWPPPSRSCGGRTARRFHVSCAVSPFKYPARGLPVSVREAREEDRRRREHGDHPGGLGRQEVHRAEALSRRARPDHAAHRQRLRARRQGGRAHGHGQPARVLGVAGFGGRDRARSRGRRQGAGRAARARRRHGRDPQGHRLRRRLHRRHAQSQLHRPHHPARRGAGAALEGTPAPICSSGARAVSISTTRPRSRSRRARSCRWCSTPRRRRCRCRG